MACSTDIEGAAFRDPTNGGASCISLKNETTAASDCWEDEPGALDDPPALLCPCDTSASPSGPSNAKGSISASDSVIALVSIVGGPVNLGRP